MKDISDTVNQDHEYILKQKGADERENKEALAVISKTARDLIGRRKDDQ